MDIQKQIQDLLSRGFVKLSNRASKMRELQAEFLAGEVRDELEHIEPYGFSSEPITDGKAKRLPCFWMAIAQTALSFVLLTYVIDSPI